MLNRVSLLICPIFCLKSTVHDNVTVGTNYTMSALDIIHILIDISSISIELVNCYVNY